jgi:high-affinity nickel-transport protein
VATLVTAYASLADHFELLGYIVVAIFAASWLCAAALWRFRGLAEKYGDRPGTADDVAQQS